MLKAAALQTKIQGPIGWCVCHSYRAWLDETGAPLGVQQRLMRHANIATTMNVYGGASMEAKRKFNTSVVQRVLLQDHPKQQMAVSWTASVLAFQSLSDHFGPQSKI